MFGRSPGRALVFVAALAVAMALLPSVASAQVIVKVNDTVNFRLGFQLQEWADWTQDPISTGYQQSLFLRRVRFILAGNIAKDVSFFMQTDNPRVGNSIGTAAKSLNTGLLLQDGFGEWRVAGNDMFILDGGKFLIPETRNSLQSTSSHLSWDAGTFTFLQIAGEQGDAGRDIGFQVKSYLVSDHLELRGGVFDGFRAAANAGGAGSRNSYRFAVRGQYNIWDTEKGYVYAGTNLGKKSILSFGAGYDTQGTYKSYGADFMIDMPIGGADPKGKDAFTMHAEYIRWDGGCGLNPAGTARLTNCLIPTLFKQDTVFSDAGYYIKAFNLQPFIRFEWQGFVDNIDQFRNQRRYGGGFNYYITPSAQNLKVTGAVERIVPNTKGAATWQTKNTWHYLMQLQFFYF